MTRFIVLITLLLLLCCSALVGSSLSSVQAVDEGKTSSRISLRLSEGVDYQFSSTGKTLSLTLPGVKLGTNEAQYRRLSHVIDYISLSEDESASYVTIRMMDEFRVSHSRTSSGISIQIGNPPPPRQKPAAPKLMPPKPEGGLQSVAGDSPASRDSLASNPVKPKAIRRPALRSKAGCPELWAGFVAVFEAHPLVYGLCLLLILVLLAKLLLPGRSGKQQEDKQGPDLGLNGATLIMDSETKARMIRKLMDEGWTAGEISREMKLSLIEVEQIVSDSRPGEKL